MWVVELRGFGVVGVWGFGVVELWGYGTVLLATRFWGCGVFHLLPHLNATLTFEVCLFHDSLVCVLAT